MKIAITQGDTNGVGLEVILKALACPTMAEQATMLVYASPKAAAFYRKAIDIECSWNVISTPSEAVAGRINILSTTDEEVKIDMGQPTPESGAAALQALERAVADLKAGAVDALVTAPINKAAIQSDTFNFCGHTEYLAHALSTQEEPQQPLMILMNDTLRVALVTTHLPLRQVADAITEEAILAKLRLFDHSLQRDFLITHPRIAVLSLNPHAGDNGVLGNEEADIIAPAIAKACEEGMHAYGPFAADGFFGSHAYDHYDGILAMYHDQGLTAFKALAMENGVNYTAGLSIVRTSPDHGTGYDIAGKGIADDTSLRQAIYQAIDILKARQLWDEGHDNPLPKLYKERREDERPNRRPGFKPRTNESAAEADKNKEANNTEE